MKPFRVAVRAFPPFESAICKQWASFEAEAQSGLSLEVAPLDLDDLHAAIFRGNRDLDAAFLVTDWIAEAAATGAVIDLAPYIASDPPEGYPEAWTPSLLRFQQVNGSILGLPYHDGPECLIYRRDLFDEAGLAPPRTWPEFHQAARKTGGAIFAAYPDGHNTVYDFCLQLWSRGGELFDASGRPTLDTAAVREALHFYREILRDPDAVHPRCREFDSVQSGYAFAAGEGALMVNWFGFAAMCETAPESSVRGRVGVAQVPGGVSLNVYWTLAVPSSCRRPHLAYRFLRHCASAGMDKLLTLEGGIGCRKSTWTDADVNRTIPFYRELERLHAGARELPRMARWAEIASAIDELVLGNIDEPAAQRRVESLL